MTCGCNTYYPFPGVRCGSDRFPPCDPLMTPFVTEDFVVPPPVSDVTVRVTSAKSLYVGQGVKIGTGYYQVTSIVNDTTITLQHGGQAPQGLTLYSISPQYGCYAYPVFYAGVVNIYDTDFEGRGYQQNGTTEILDSITFSDVRKLKWGYEGPYTISFSLYMSVSFSGSPYFIGVDMPGDFTPAYSTLHGVSAAAVGFLSIGGGSLVPLSTVFLFTPKLLIGLATEDPTAFTNGVTYNINVNGKYETYR